MSSLSVWRSCLARARASLLASIAVGPIALSMVCGTLASSACVVRERAHPVVVESEPVYADVDVAPVVNIETYPQTVYEGRTVYYYNDRWYFRNGPHWTYYRHEPPLLVQHRARFVGRPEEHREEHREEVRHEERRDERRDEHHEEHHDEHHEGHR